MKTDFRYNKDIKKKKIIKNINIIPVPLYRCNVEIIFGKNTKQLETDWGNGMSFGGKTRNYLDDKNRSILITFPDNNPILSTVVHELCHATQMILKEAGHDYTFVTHKLIFRKLIGFKLEKVTHRLLN